MKEFLIVFYFVVAVILFLYGFHFYIILFLFQKSKKKPLPIIKSIPLETKWPKVTLQLPLYNEYNVVEQLLEKVIQIKYPFSQLQIQVLDDSTDETQVLMQKICQDYSQKGYPIEYHHRSHREGFKAGALKEGLKKAKGEYIAIFDADFIPNPDFLVKTIPYFLANPKVGLVQTRWDYTNRDYSLLTHLQAVALDGHFMIEQKSRSDNGLWFNFNGTAGIWKKECIFDAGNWAGDTLTEDLDLSYRAQIKGWKMIYEREVGNASELPITVPAYKAQQFRWAKGAFQCAKKLSKKILTSSAPLSSKLEAFVHLVNYGAYLFIAFNFLLILPMAKVSFLTQENMWKALPWYFALAFFVLGLLGPLIYFYRSQKERNTPFFKTLLGIGSLLIINFGLTFMVSKAFFEVLLKKSSFFVRTPKFNFHSSSKQAKKHYAIKIEILNIFEFLGLLYGGYTVAFCFVHGFYGAAVFAFLYTLGFFWILFGTLKDYFFFSKKIKKNLSQKF